jgi:hypothetical protein
MTKNESIKTSHIQLKASNPYDVIYKQFFLFKPERRTFHKFPT